MVALTRRRVLSRAAALAGAYGLGLAGPGSIAHAKSDPDPLRRAIDTVLRSGPVPTGLDLGPPVAKLLEAGAIDAGKFTAIYKYRGSIPQWVSRLLEGKQRHQELIFSVENAAFNLNLLWPIGLATKAALNDESPIGGKYLPYYASTGGWTLGRESNGAAYFNEVETLSLSPAQSSRARRIADNVYRPCCGNSAFFQDCNHGSAMLGLIEMAAADGRETESIMKLAKVANSLWYPRAYVEAALYFDVVKDTSWDKIPADVVLSSNYSSIGGWGQNIHAALLDQGLIAPPRGGGGGAGCAV